MGTCPACGASTDVDDRFCPTCGASQADAVETINPGHSGDGEAAGDQEVELLGSLAAPSARPGPAPPGGQIRQGPIRRGPRLAVAGAVAGLAAVVFGAWAVGRAGPDGTDVGADATTSVTDGSATTDLASAGTDATTPDGSPTDSSPADGSPADSGTAASGTDASVPIGNGGGAIDGEYPVNGSGPVLGRPIGWSLLIGSPSGSRLERIDLDTGERQRYDTAGGPRLVLGGHVVLQRQDELRSSLSLVIVSLSDPDAGEIEVPLGDTSFFFASPLVPGADDDVWVYAGTPAGASWQLVRLSDGTVTDRVTAPPALLSPPVSGAGPDIATSGTGGVYRRDGGRYRQLAPGAPIAGDQRAVLTRTCADPTTCRLQWLDTATGQPVDRPVPPAESDVDWFGVAEPAGHFVIGRRTGEGGARYDAELVAYDLDRNRMVTPGVDFQAGLAAATPDGRYLAVQGDDGIKVYDAEQDRWVTVRRALDSTVTVVFVPNDGS